MFRPSLGEEKQTPRDQPQQHVNAFARDPFTTISPAPPASSSASSSLPLLSPPAAFAIVEPGLYRSNAPSSPGHIAFFAQLGLRSVIWLAPEMPQKSFRQFLEDNKIFLKHQGLKSWKPTVNWKVVNEELVKEALEFVLDVTNHPVCVISGAHESGAVIGCLRRLQQWALTNIVDEYRRMAGTKARSSEIQFFELFDVDLVTLPAQLPDWFREQMAMLQQEEDDLLKKHERKSVTAQQPTITPAIAVAAGASPNAAAVPAPAPMDYYELSLRSELVSAAVTFDKKLSIVSEDDD